MNENEVVATVAAQLEAEGWTIVSRCDTHTTGPDIVAERSGERLVIEAKGARSSKEGTKRFGRGFHKGQRIVSLAMAVYTAMRVVSRGEPGVRTGIALPDVTGYRDLVDEIQPALDRLGVDVLWAKG